MYSLTRANSPCLLLLAAPSCVPCQAGKLGYVCQAGPSTNLHDVVVQVDAALVGPLVNSFAHGGCWCDGVDEGHVVEGVCNVGCSLVAINGLHDSLAGALGGHWLDWLHRSARGLAVLLELGTDIPGSILPASTKDGSPLSNLAQATTATLS